MALKEIYVDPSIAGNSGTGTSGDPYGDLQYCLNNATHDTTEGTRINIKAGTAESLTASLDFTSFGSPALGAPCFIQGYTSTAGDGGIGDIDGAGSYSIINSTTLDGFQFVDMKLHNSGSNKLFEVDDYCSFVNCELYDCAKGIVSSSYLYVLGCKFHGFTDIAVDSAQTPFTVKSCFFDATNASYAGTTVLDSAAGGSVIEYNTILIKSGSSNGISQAGLFGGGAIHNNSIFSNGGTGTGIKLTGTSYGGTVLHNAVEGFSGTGGKGYDLASQPYFNNFSYNISYNNATHYANTDDENGLKENEEASAGLFSDAANADKDNYRTKFEPADTDGMRAGGLGGDFKGAIPPPSSGGGGGTRAWAYA